MTSAFKTYVSSRFDELVNASLSSKAKKDIIVLLGLGDILDTSNYKNNLVDAVSFDIDGDSTVFDEEDWFGRMFISLREQRSFHLMSFQQFVYYSSYAPNLQKFKNRVVIIYDNVRSLFPIKNNSFIEKTGTENIEERPNNLPLYQAEQVSIEGKAYCSYITPTECQLLGFFDDKVELNASNSAYDEVLAIDDHLYTLDVFLNEALLPTSSKRILGIKNIKDILRADEFGERLKLANGLLKLIGAGEIVLINENAVDESYVPREETKALLKKYWGDHAEFRSLNIYKNPGESNKVVAISQGHVVDTIIDEYNQCQEDGYVPNDVFITAPTGSGKSLLFQLPAFYVSEKGDVTIVVSPLIALMKDQVSAIKRDRNFQKVAYINSELNLIDRDHIINFCKSGELDVLYMSPELLLSYDISFFVGERKIGLLVVDEAHLITTWGRDFRVDYWHLGNHVNKIRKYKKLRFPIVALTATAIYGGPNDMVVDSMGSLYMHNPHLYLGQVKRENIRFVINNHKGFDAGYKKNKISQTVEFIKEADKNNLKTVVYAPYTRHVAEIMEQVKDIAVPYHGALSADTKDFSYHSFRNNDKKIMVCTKAFGMGVDIPDIQVIYHHAPSGLLPDYVQEIGRAARDPRMVGFAALNYHEQDKQYSIQLFGMSAIRQWQIREVLKKIYSIYKLSGNRRNLLVSSEDFSYIFNDGDIDGVKVKTALMMIEKDYLTKIRYNALIARPKQMFVKCYGRTDAFGLSVLENKYPGFYRRLRTLGGAQYVVELDLDAIWQKDFSDMSFGAFKQKFYAGALLKDDKVDLVALTKYTLSLKQDSSIVKERFFYLLDVLEKVFTQMGNNSFNKDEFDDRLAKYFTDKDFRRQLGKYVLSAFSGKRVGMSKIEENAFLQRRDYGEVSYMVFTQGYRTTFFNMKRILTKMFEDPNKTTVDRFFSNENDSNLTYTRLGSFIEMLDLGTYECKGGDNPMIFVRLNDPDRVRRDSEDPKYTNGLLTRTMKRHDISNELFDHFFTNTFTSEERWDYIEEFFLGATNEELFEQFPENHERNHVDIIKYIVENSKAVEHNIIESETKGSQISFPPREKGQYSQKSMLTIDDRTLSIDQWIKSDPVSLDIARRRHTLYISKELYYRLMSKLKSNHWEYYRDALGLKIQIEFKGYEGIVQASVPYNNNPVEFYKWWVKKENNDKVSLSKLELIKLLLRVNDINPKAIRAKDMKLITK